MLNLDFASLIKESCLTLNTMSMQLSFFLIDQKCNVCIDGRKFLIRTLLKDLGLKRLAPICYITLICSTLFIWAWVNFCFLIFFSCRRMIKLLNWYQNMGLQNGLSLQSLCLAALGNNAERGKLLKMIISLDCLSIHVVKIYPW